MAKSFSGKGCPARHAFDIDVTDVLALDLVRRLIEIRAEN